MPIPAVEDRTRHNFLAPINNSCSTINMNTPVVNRHPGVVSSCWRSFTALRSHTPKISTAAQLATPGPWASAVGKIAKHDMYICCSFRFVSAYLYRECVVCRAREKEGGPSWGEDEKATKNVARLHVSRSGSPSVPVLPPLDLHPRFVGQTTWN